MARHVGSFSLLAITFGILAVGLAAPSPALAQTGTADYWDSASGTGVLWGTASDWNTNATGSGGSSVVPTTSSDAYFNGSADYGTTTVQLGGAASALGLYFNNTGTTLLESSSSTPETLSIGTDGVTVALTAGAVTLGDPSSVNLMPISITGSQAWTNNSTTSALNVFSAISETASSTLTIAGAGNTTISGAISNGTGTLGLTKSGIGTLTLSAIDTYTGTTTVSGGTLALTPATATAVINSVANSSALVLAGGSLTMTGPAGVNAVQPFNGTTISPGGSSISAIDGASGGNFDVTLGTIARTVVGGAVSFTLPAGPQSSTNGISTMTSNNTAGILGGWATVGGNWAVSSASAGAGVNISALSSYTGVLPSTASTSTTANYTLAGAQTQAGVVSANSLNITDINSVDALALGANNLTFNGASGGLLYSGGSSYSISGTGFIGSGTTTAELIVTTTGSGNLTVSAPLVTTSTTAGTLTKAGTGTLTLTGASKYTGATTVAGGTLVVVNTSDNLSGSPLGNTPITVYSGATFAAQAGLGTITLGSGIATTSKLILNPGSTFSMVDGEIGILTLAAKATPALAFNGATLGFDVGVPGTDLLQATNTSDTASVSGINTINLTPFGSLLPVSGTYPLISIRNTNASLAGTYQFANGTPTESLTVGGKAYTATLGYSTSQNVQEQVTIVQQGPTLTWTGQAMGTGTQAENWDIGTSTNWANSSNSAVTYSDGSNVAFTDTNAVLGPGNFVNNSTITIQPGGVTPAAVSFNTSAVGYIITALSGPIQGATTTLTVTGGEGVVILNENTYGGGTWVSSNQNQFAGAQIGTSTTVAGGVITQGPLGTGTINLVGGALEDNGTTVTLANNIAISDNMLFYSMSSGKIILDGTNVTPASTVALSNNPILSVGNTTIINDIVTGSGQNLTAIGASKQGVLALNGANTYTGITTVTDSVNNAPLVLSVSNLAVEGSLGGIPSSLGESSNAASNLVLNAGILQYTGSGSTTDRLFTLGPGNTTNGGTLDASGTGPIVWSNAGAIVDPSNYPLTLTGSNTGANTLTPILAGSATLTKSGAGTWVVAGANTTTGNTNISGGILAVTGTGQLYNEATSDSTSVITVTTGGTLEIDRWNLGGAGEFYGAGQGSFGNLAGTNTLLLISGGTIMYSGSTNNHVTSDTRGFTIEGSGATLDAATAGQTWFINSGTNTIAISSLNTSGAALTLNGPGIGVLDEVIPTSTNPLGLTMSGGTWTLTAANKYTGATALNAGTLVMGNTNALFTSPVTLTTANNGLQFAAGLGSASLGSLTGGGNIVLQDNAGSPASGAAIALTVGGNNTSTNYSGSLSGSGSLTMNGTGAFTLSGASTYTGTTTVTKGTLQLSSTAPLGNTAISVASGATLAPLAGALGMPNTITAGSTGAPGAGASLNLGSGAIFNMFSLSNSNVGTFQLQQGSGFNTPALTLGGATLDFGLNGSVGTYELPAVDLLAAGGTASVSGTNTINLTLLNPSVLNPGGPINLITASSGLNVGGTFQLSPASANMTVGGVPYVLTLNTTPTALTLTIISNGPTLTWTGEGGTGPSGNPANTAPWDISSTNNWANSTNQAATFFTGDTVIFNDSDAIALTQVTNSTVNIQSTGVSPTAVTFNNSNVNYTLTGGPIVGAATLSKTGTGLLSIQNTSNLYARGTTLSQGTLQISSSTTTGGGAVTSGPLGTGTLTLSGGTLDIGNSNIVTLANSIAITANTSFTTSSGGGALILDGTSLATPATVVLSNNPTLTVNNTTTINDVISGSAQSLTLAGSGTLILGGANTYPGVTTISSGTLQLGNGTNNGSVAGSITDDSALVFLTTGTPSYATAISGSGSVTVNGTGAGALTLSGGNSFQGGLTILGNSVVTLSGANSYSGGTLIQSGTLRAGAGNTLPATGSVTFGGTASATGTLDLNGYGLTVGGLFVAPAAASNSANQIITNSNTSGHGSTATLTYSGAGSNSFAGTLQNGSVSNLLALTVTSGNLTLSGTNTYTGATAVNGGTLQVASPGSLASAVTVNSPATLSGSGAIGGLVTVNSGGVLAPSGVASAATTMTLTGGLTLANGAVLDFNLGIPGSGDSVNVTGGALSLGTTGGTLNINEFGGGGELEATSYPLIFDSSITGNAALWNVGDHVGDTGHSYSFTDTGGQFDLVVSVSSSNATWISPSDSNYNNGPNWSSGTVPSGAGLVVTFGSGSQAMVSVNGSFIVGQLNFNNGGNSGAPASYLLAGNGNLTLNNSGGGASVNVSSGSLAPSLGANVTLTLADSSLTTTFNIASGSSLVVGGAIGQSSSGQRVVLAGGGTLELESPNTYTGSTTINSGIFQVDSGASIASTSVSIGAGGTLQLVGTTGALPSTTNIATHGTGSAGDGALVLLGAATETVGTISGDTRQITDGSQQVTVYSGNTTVGDGNNSASLTATQILGNTLTINSNSTVTIAPSGNGIPTDAQGSEAVSGVALAAGSSDSSSDSSGDPFTAIEAAIDSGAISSAKGQQLENRIAAIERLAATDPGLDVSLLEDRVLAALPSSSVWSSSGDSPIDSGTGLLAVDSGTSGSSSDSSLGGATAFAPAAAFGGAPAAVPEPSALLLATMAGIGILIAVRRRSIYCKSRCAAEKITSVASGLSDEYIATWEYDAHAEA